MTHDETRDELAQMDGWRKYADGRWYKQGEWPKRDHPYPPTLDGANAAVPEGWYWLRDQAATSHRPDGLLLRWVACERGAHNWRVVEVPDTGDPVHDLYALAMACRRAMENKT